MGSTAAMARLFFVCLFCFALFNSLNWTEVELFVYLSRFIINGFKLSDLNKIMVLRIFISKLLVKISWSGASVVFVVLNIFFFFHQWGKTPKHSVRASFSHWFNQSLCKHFLMTFLCFLWSGSSYSYWRKLPESNTNHRCGSEEL